MYLLVLCWHWSTLPLEGVQTDVLKFIQARPFCSTGSSATTDSQLICLLSNYIPSFQEWNISSMNSLSYNGWIVCYFTHTLASPNPQVTQTKVLAVLSHESGCSSFHSLLAFTGKQVQLLAIEEGHGWGPEGYRCHCFLSSHEPVNIPCWH